MLNLGIIGVGGYGLTHVHGFLALQTEGRVRIAALADAAAAALHDLDAHPGLKNARRFLDYRDLLALPGLDAVLVSAPIPFHLEITLSALERDLFILLEKPPAPLLSQLDELIAADRDGRVMVAFQHIYSPLVGKAKACIQGGQLGRLASVSAHGVWPRPTSYYERAGWAGRIEWAERTVLDGPCTNAFAHYINLALHLCGDGPADFAPPSSLRGEVYRARPQIASYDAAALTGVLEGNIAFAAGFAHAATESSRVQISVKGSRNEICFSNDCETARFPDGTELHGDDGRETMWGAFLALAGGDASQNRTPLQAARPFVLATNLMLQSSGGIHPVPEEYVQISGSEARTFFALPGIAGLLSQCANQFLPLNRAGAAWAVETSPVSAAEFLEQEMMLSLGASGEKILPSVC